MSRVGRSPIDIPKQVTVSITPENLVQVKGPIGELALQVEQPITVALADGVLTVQRPDDDRKNRSLHGLYRALLANMVTGVSTGFVRRLQIEGVGYRADKDTHDATAIKLRLGLSHEVVVRPLPGVILATEGTQTIVISGPDKQQVGQMAATIRALRPVEPYKGKGIRHQGERVRRKAGKSAKVGG